MTALKRNIEQGFYAGGTFHPIRASVDYDDARAGEGHRTPASPRLRRVSKALKKRLGGSDDKSARKDRLRGSLVNDFPLAYAAATDAGNRNMAKHGRSVWNKDDYNVAANFLNRLHPTQNPAGIDFEAYSLLAERIHKAIQKMTLAEWGRLMKRYAPKGEFMSQAAVASEIAKGILYRGDVAPAWLRKQNPDLLSTFATLAGGIASTMHINDMLEKKSKAKAKKAPAKRKNPSGMSFWRVHLVADDGTEFDLLIAAKTLAGATRSALSSARRSQKVWGGSSAVTIVNIEKEWTDNPRAAAKVEAKGGTLYLLTISQGADTVGVYLHDGDYNGMKKFKTLKAAKAYATRNKKKLVENPKDNGILSSVKGSVKRAIARSKAASELKKELRAEAKLERIRSRKAKALKAAKANPKGRDLAFYEQHGIGRSRYVVNFEDGTTHKDGSPFFGIRVFSSKREKDRFIKSLLSRGYKRNPVKGRAAKANPVNVKANPSFRATRSGVKYLSTRTHSGSILRLATAPDDLQDVSVADLNRMFRAKIARLKNDGLTNKQIAAALANDRWKVNPKKSAPVPRRRTYEMFQGREATTAERLAVSRHAPERLDQLGDLIELKLNSGRVLKFPGKKFRLCAAGGKLWIAGGKFAKANPAGKANEINPIDAIDHVVYGTRKPHHGDNAYTHYIHRLGEESGHQPTLCVDKEGFPVIRGGKYKIEARGIVN